MYGSGLRIGEAAPLEIGTIDSANMGLRITGKGDKMEWFTYGHFYAAPAMYMVGGDAWKDWYSRVKDLLMANVHREGDFASWEPMDRKVGVVYSTAVYTMILAMPYHYVPLYQR